MDVSAEYSKPGADQDDDNAIGYGYPWWMPEGDQGDCRRDLIKQRKYAANAYFQIKSKIILLWEFRSV